MSTVSKRIEEACSQGLFYEAQVMYKGLFHKFEKTSSFDKATAVLLNGIDTFYKHQQMDLVMDMSLDLLSLFDKAKVSPTSPINASTPIAILTDLSGKFSTGTKRIEFLKACVKWSAKVVPQIVTGVTNGYDDFHFQLAGEYQKIGDYSHAHKHYTRCSHPVDHAKMLISWSKLGSLSERDLFVTRAILQLLCMVRMKDSRTVFELYMKKLKETDPKWKDTALVHFCSILLIAVEKGNGPLFEIAQQKFSYSLSRDAAFEKYLKQIGKHYFGIVEQDSSMGGMFGNLLSGLMGN
jgi:hypothetical protein